eukprot:Opistho-2@78006
MSGIQEWRNAVMLFVNVSAESDDDKSRLNTYDNMFLDRGRRITWFAQTTQHPGTPVIQRLLSTPRDAHPVTFAAGDATSQTSLDVKPSLRIPLKRELKTEHHTMDNRTATTAVKLETCDGADNVPASPVMSLYGDSVDSSEGTDTTHDDAKEAVLTDGVHLFCRLPQRAYVYMGRLELESFDGHVRPMRFVWHLVDYGEDTLRREDSKCAFWDVVQCGFKGEQAHHTQP